MRTPEPQRQRPAKPLGIKSYGSIGHLPGSRLGPRDHHVHEGQARICTERTRDKHDTIHVQEKVDGGCVAVALINGEIVALGRRGYLASTSPFEQHHLFADWVERNRSRFRAVLDEGERLCGEWLAQAHGTRYDLPHEPFVAFDLMRGHERIPLAAFIDRLSSSFIIPRLLHAGPAFSIDQMLECLEPSGHGAIDPVEGAVWRVERKGKVDFLAKWVRPDKVDGCYLPELTEAPPVWNWKPGDA